MEDLPDVSDIEFSDEADEADTNQRKVDNTEEKKVATKPKQMRPTINKLLLTSLQTTRGLERLPQYFENINWKKDAKFAKFLKVYQYWCHQICPKLEMQDCIDQIEKWGNKKEIRTHIRKIRLNVPTETVNEVSNDNALDHNT